MKVTPYSGEAESFEGARREKMTALLSLWAPMSDTATRDLVQGAPGSDSQWILTSEERGEWGQMLRESEAIAPMTFAPALQRLLDVTQPGVVVAELEKRRALKRHGNRIALSNNRELTRQLDGGRRWSVYVPMRGDPLKQGAILEKRFIDVRALDDGFLCWQAWRERGPADLGTLLTMVEPTSTSDAALLDAWALASALEIDANFLASLSDQRQRQLVTCLEKLVRDNIASLTMEVDIDLWTFERPGQYRFDAISFPECRINELERASRQLGYVHIPIIEDYFLSVLCGFLRTASALEIGELLKCMPPGHVLDFGLLHLTHNRPSVLATLVHYPEWQAEGFRGIAALLPEGQLGTRFRVDRLTEWHDVQRLARAQLVLGSGDWISALAVAIRDEEVWVGAQTAWSPRLAVEPANMLEHWRKAIHEDAETSEELTNALCDLLAHPECSEGVLLVALRLLPELDERSMRTLGEHIAHSYARRFTTGKQLRLSLGAVRLMSAQLGRLADVLSSGDDRSFWERFLRPFTVAQVIKGILDNGDRDARAEIDAKFVASEAVGVHAVTLLAALEYVPTRLIDEVLTTLGHYYFDEAEAVGDAFSWWSRPNQFGDRYVEAPLTAFSRRAVNSERGRSIVRRLIRNDPDIITLARVVLGCGEHEYAETLREHLADVARASLESELDGAWVGYLLNVARLLQDCALANLAESFCFRAFAECEQNPRAAEWREEAAVVLASSLAAQSKWTDVLAVSKPMQLERRDQMRNLHAVALMNLGEHDKAEKYLDEILSRDRYNRPALINKTALYVRARRWTSVLEACGVANDRLEVSSPEVAANESVARSQLEKPGGDVTEAVAIDSQAANADQISAKMLGASRAAICMVYEASGKNVGTGFLISSTHIVTAAHLFAGEQPRVAAFEDGQVIPLQDLDRSDDDKVDLAVARLETPVRGVPLQLADECELYEDVVAWGYPRIPHSADTPCVPARGRAGHTVTATMPAGARFWILLECITRGGYSGGPVLNARGQVVGVVSGASHNKVDPEQMNRTGHVADSLGYSVCVPLDVLRTFLSARPLYQLNGES